MIVEPHLDRTISDFLTALSNENKVHCRNWINEWQEGNYSGWEVLNALAEVLAIRQ